MSDKDDTVEPPPLFIGVHLPADDYGSNHEVVQSSLLKGYDMVTTRITNTEYKKHIQRLFRADFDAVDDSYLSSSTSSNGLSQPYHFHVPPPELHEICLLPGAHVSNSICVASPWLEIDSKNPRLANISLQVLLHELAYASFCGASYCLLPGPRRRNNVAQYARTILALLEKSPFVHLLVHLPFEEIDHTKKVDELSVWDIWNSIRSIADYPKNLSVALQMPSRAPSPILENRWFAEPISMIMVSSSSFVSNAKQYPVLTKSLQHLLLRFFAKKPFILIEDRENVTFNGGTEAYLLYIKHLIKQQPRLTESELAIMTSYQDLLQAPLQPLVDNLESATYEAFEKDPVKYELYKLAISKAMQEMVYKSHVRIAIVGAGRGPLVDKALEATRGHAAKISITALEKNDAAFIYLCFRNKNDWNGTVELVRGDMRTFSTSQKFDLIVSELLGSFGDNELSPECLDGVQKCLSPSGIMIPSSYSAYLAPAMSHKLFVSSRQGIKSGRLSNAKATEVPYVVMLDQVDIMALPETAWTFDHPSPFILPDNTHNTRRCRLKFHIPKKGVVHGIAGYFSAVLYGEIEFSILPAKKQKEMMSWFPMWFPLNQAMYCEDSTEVDVSFWRSTDGKKVWYEWAVETYTLTENNRRFRTGACTLHNKDGHHSSMLL